MTPRSTSRVDLHCHSTASAVSKLGVQRALGLPECATPPEEVYELAKRRGMDFVTITDHDTIDGALELAAKYDDAFVSEELTAWFRGEPQAVHILCWGITQDDHQRLQYLSRDVEAVAAELRARSIACALAHPFYAVEAPLLPRHRRRLAQLFPIWETRNGSRARELNAPAVVYIETHGGTGVGGSDDHAGIDIGRTFTETPRARDWRRFLDHIVLGNATARGEQGSAAKWTHAAMGARDPRARPRPGGRRRPGRGGRPDPDHVFEMVQRLMREGDARTGATGTGLGPEDARALLRAWMASVELDLTEPELLALLQHEDFSHADLFRRARRCHERKLAKAVDEIAAAAPGGADIAAAATTLFDACLAAIPYAPAAAFLGREKAKLAHRDGEPLRVALVADAVGGMHGVTHTLDELRERGVPGFEVEVVGTDANVDRRLSAVAEIDIPFYAGLKVGVPSLPAIVEVARRRALRPRPPLLARARPARPPGSSPGSWACRCSAATTPSSPPTRACARRTRGSRSPPASRSPPSTASASASCRRAPPPTRCCAGWASPAERIGRWDRGVDLARFSPERRDARAAAGRDHRPLRGSPHPREGRRPARRRVPRRPGARPPPAPRARRRRARGGRAARTPRRARDVPRLARGRRARGRLRERRRLPLRQPHGHVRPGPARSASERPGGRGGRRRRADEHRHRRRDGSPVLGRRRRPGRPSSASSPPSHCSASASRAAHSMPSAERTWERSLQRLADGYRRALDPTAGADAGIDSRRAA